MPYRRATTLITAAMFLTCAGLLFPGVQKVRDAAARMKCHGHFKQLALALHNCAAGYSVGPDAPVGGTGGFGFGPGPLARTPDWPTGPVVVIYPTGTVPHPTLPPERRLSWVVPTLPFIEQGTAFKQFDLTRGPDDPRNQGATSNRFTHLTCPASGEHDRDGSGETWRPATPVTHYVGMAGVGADAATLKPGHPRAGVFGYDRRITFETGIPDGTSNTLLLIETANDPGHWAFGGRATVRAFEPGAAPYLGPGRPFGGFHNGGPVPFGARSHTCTAALADGSVRSLTSLTAPEVLEALATAGGKEELPPNW